MRLLFQVGCAAIIVAFCTVAGAQTFPAKPLPKAESYGISSVDGCGSRAAARFARGLFAPLRVTIMQ